MFNLGEYIIDPNKVSVISPLMKVEERTDFEVKTFWHLFVVCDGQRVTICDQDSYKMTSYRDGIRDAVLNRGSRMGYR